MRGRAREGSRLGTRREQPAPALRHHASATSRRAAVGPSAGASAVPTLPRPVARRGYNIGIRLVDEFLAKAQIASCSNFMDTAEVIAKVAAMLPSLTPPAAPSSLDRAPPCLVHVFWLRWASRCFSG